VDLFVILLIGIIIALILSIVSLILVLRSFAPFKKMKRKELDDCYDLRQIYKNTKKDKK